MKKIILNIFAATLSVLLIACNSTEKRAQSSHESIASAQTTTETALTSAVTTSVTTVSTTTTPSAAIHTRPSGETPFAQELEFEDMNCGREFIFLNKYGRYYYNEIGGRQSANHVLCLDRGYGEPENLYDTEDCNVVYHDDDAIYLSKRLNEDGMYKTDHVVYYKVEDTNVTQISPRDIPDKQCSYSLDPLNSFVVYAHKRYYPEDRDDIYYLLEYCTTESVGTVYRVEGNDKKTLIYVGSPQTAQFYDNKIWYSDSYGDKYKLTCYDLETGEKHILDYGRMGIVNNGYMYCEYGYPYCTELYRIDLSTFKEEKVFESTKIIYNNLDICFFKNHIFYATREKDNLGHYNTTVYRFGEDGNVPIFEAKDGYYVNNIQCHGDHLYLELGCGGFWLGVFEIDTDGNVLEVVHEDHEGWCSNHIPYFSDEN